MVNRSDGQSIEGHIRGWDVGCRVVIRVDKDGRDHVYIYHTWGSNGGEERLIADYTT